MKFTFYFSVFCLLVSCKEKPQAKAPEPEEPPACCSDVSAPEALEVSVNSIYQVESKWRDASGNERTLASLAGHIRVISMGYTSCQYACPRLLLDMRKIEDGLTDQLRKQTRFTFVSIDPETDTPERLAEYRTENELNSETWTFLTGDNDSVQELAVVTGVQYRKTTDKDYAHSNVITVLNSKGEIIHRQEGLAADPANTIKAIAKAAQ